MSTVLTREVKKINKSGEFPLRGTESDAAWAAAQTIDSLRLLTRQTGTRTTRTQNDLLQALSEKDLTDVARILSFVGWEN